MLEPKDERRKYFISHQYAPSDAISGLKNDKSGQHHLGLNG